MTEFLEVSDLDSLRRLLQARRPRRIELRSVTDTNEEPWCTTTLESLNEEHFDWLVTSVEGAARQLVIQMDVEDLKDA